MAGAKGWAQLLELRPIATATGSWALLSIDLAERRQRRRAREKRVRDGNLDRYGTADTARPVEGSREMYISTTHMTVDDCTIGQISCVVAIMHQFVLLICFSLFNVGQAFPISRVSICSSYWYCEWTHCPTSR